MQDGRLGGGDDEATWDGATATTMLEEGKEKKRLRYEEKEERFGMRQTP